MKPVVWCGDSLERIREFPADARRLAGHQLDKVQRGLDPDDWKPMPSVGLGVREIRVRAQGQYRVVYLAKFEEAVYVLHAFAKKTQRTAKQDLELAATRFRELREVRRRR
ncbi:MAG: type II toxin-antitoxin system RelE/ParE family toxin [Burkholderiales bacterium]